MNNSSPNPERAEAIRSPGWWVLPSIVLLILVAALFWAHRNPDLGGLSPTGSEPTTELSNPPSVMETREGIP